MPLLLGWKNRSSDTWCALIPHRSWLSRKSLQPNRSEHLPWMRHSNLKDEWKTLPDTQIKQGQRRQDSQPLVQACIGKQWHLWAVQPSTSCWKWLPWAPAPPSLKKAFPSFDPAHTCHEQLWCLAALRHLLQVDWMSQWLRSFTSLDCKPACKNFFAVLD